jgi:hypothetical protein
MTRRLFPLLLLPLAFGACGDQSITFEAEASSLTDFASGLEGWAAVNAGLAPGSNLDVRGESGVARMDIDAAGPGGRAIIARDFDLTPGVAYEVEISFTLVSPDVSDFPWIVSVGATEDDAPFAFLDVADTTTPAAGTPLTVSTRVAFSTDVATDPDDETEVAPVRIAVGISPTTVGVRSYDFDDVSIEVFRDVD